MQILTSRGLFSGLRSEDPHAHITKVRSVCKYCVGRPVLNMDIIGLRVFPLSLTGEDTFVFTKLPYNSIYISIQLRDVLLVCYYPMSKKVNHKDRLNNIAELSGESISSSWDRFTSFLRSVPNERIDDESLNELFYGGKHDNNKTLLDTIVVGSYGQFPYDEIAEKLEKIFRNNKA